MGARSQGMANASLCLEDTWSVFNNVGGLAKVDQVTVAFSHLQFPGMKSFKRTALAIALPTPFGTGGLGVFRFGDDLYNEQLLTAGFSNTFGLASLGLQVNYIQYAAEGFGTKGVFSLTFGGVARLTPVLTVGAQIVNLLQPKISAEGEKLPTLVSTGFLFKPSENLLLTTEIEKDLSYPLRWKSGMEYVLHKKLAARTGFAINPDAAFVGVGFKASAFMFDYSFAYDFNVSSSHQATVSYKFKRKAE